MCNQCSCTLDTALVPFQILWINSSATQADSKRRVSLVYGAEEHTGCVAVLRSAEPKLLIQRLASFMSTCSFVSHVRASRWRHRWRHRGQPSRALRLNQTTDKTNVHFNTLGLDLHRYGTDMLLKFVIYLTIVYDFTQKFTILYPNSFHLTTKSAISGKIIILMLQYFFR